MKIEFAPLEGKSPQFYLFMLVLFAIAGAGLFATYLMYTQGLHITGMSNRAPWGLAIVMLIYYIGLSAGSLVLGDVRPLWPGVQALRQDRRVSRHASPGGGADVDDLRLGKPDRVFVPFMYFNFASMFSINGILYSTYIAICFVYLLAMFAGKEKLVGVIALIAVIWAIGVHSGTGAIFGFVSRELYESPLLPPSFITAALSSGTALMILLCSCSSGTPNAPSIRGT